MALSATEPQAQASQTENALPPPSLYTPRESRFEKFVEIQEDGYRQAKSRGDQGAAIVIDNGTIP
jgi:actin-related protein 5